LSEGRIRPTDIDKHHLEEVRRKNIIQYEKALQEPYIGRLEVIENDAVLSYRIGKIAVTDEDYQDLIYDWRTPLGDVYYGFNGGDGNVTYSGPKGPETLLVSRKREVHIRKQRVLDIRDYASHSFRDSSSLTGEESDNDLEDCEREEDQAPEGIDPLLRDLWLDQHNDHQMREIIATIQREQNEVIRLGITRPILVQGVAGSGKTSIALHRISYLLYQYHDQLSASRILVLAPNQMFLQYIKDVVKELDIQGIQQSTVVDLASKLLKIKSIKTQQQWLSECIDNPELEAQVRPMLTYLTSIDFYRVVDNYLNQLTEQFLPVDVPQLPFITEAPTSVEQKFVDIYNGYRHLPLNKRRIETISSIRSWSEMELKKQQKTIEEHYFQTKKEWIDALPEELALKKELEDKLLEAAGFRYNQLKQQWNQAIDNYLNGWKPLQPLLLLPNLYNEEFLKVLAPDLAASVLQTINAKGMAISQKHIGYEDIGVLLMLEQRINGLETTWDYLVIDEAQDMNPFLLQVLKGTTRSMTMLGDITQSVFDTTGFRDWSEVREIFGEGLHELQLSISYRSTVEIMSVANHIVARLERDLPQLHPVQRHGPKPTIQSVIDGVDLLDKIEEGIREMLKAGFTRIAVIPKEAKLSRLLYAKLKDLDIPSIQLVEDTNEELTSPIVLIPATLVKGLEFDAVIIPNVNSRTYQTELDGRLLFVSVTRAQAALRMIYFDRPSRFIEGILSNDII